VVLYEQTQSENGQLVEALDGTLLATTILSLLDSPERLESMGAANAGFAHHDALEHIRRSIAGEDTGGIPSAGAPSGGGSAAPLMSNQALLSVLEHRRATHTPAGREDLEHLTAEDRAYYVSRAASLLASPAWETRNLGVKLIGLLDARDKLPLVIALLKDRRPAPWYMRMAGGDFEQVGFIRRNALASVARLGVVTREVEDVLAAALADPYYEARAEACRAITLLDRHLSDGGRMRLIAGLIDLLRDRWIEVAAAAAEALGHVGGAADARPALLALKEHRFWMVRAAGLRGLQALVESGRAGDLGRLEPDVRGFALTATDFRPEFTIRTSYARLIRAIETKRSAS
jgi:UDP-N-acetylglucosamine--N-acetylmuramyl-(pentapeptide) pyrophosphoryl-undecaprenol N-acetylglucosamine transferase